MACSTSSRSSRRSALLAGADTWHTAGFDDPGVPAIRMSDGPAGVRGTSWTGPPSASFPCGAALGATCDPALVARGRRRARPRGARPRASTCCSAPTVNLHRTPIGGRNFECFERGPGADRRPRRRLRATACSARGVAACIKHFVANDTEFERMTISSEVDERTLREMYLVPFEAAVRRAGVRVVMTLQPAQRHVLLRAPVAARRRAARRVGLRRRRRQRLVRHAQRGGVARAGLDLEMPGPPSSAASACWRRDRAGEVGEDDLDVAVSRLLALWRVRSGAGTTARPRTTADDADTRAVIRRDRGTAMVLLKNDGDVLPLARRRTRRADRPERRASADPGRRQRAGAADTACAARTRCAPEGST